MPAETYRINFEGYWRGANKSGLPIDSGIYCVYRCTLNPVTNKVDISELLYIGEADNIRERVANHERYQDWLRHLNSGEELCFIGGETPAVSRLRCEAAMIFKYKPVENEMYRYAFPFDSTTLQLSGATAFLEEYFTVHRAP